MFPTAMLVFLNAILMFSECQVGPGGEEKDGPMIQRPLHYINVLFSALSERFPPDDRCVCLCVYTEKERGGGGGGGAAAAALLRERDR